MTTPYAWRCFVCESANAPMVALCTVCGFPAVANARQIAAARAARANKSKAIHPAPVSLKQPSFFELVKALLAPLPWWRRAVVVMGGSLVTGGFFYWKIAFSIAGYAWGSISILLGTLVCALGVAGIDQRPRDES